MSKEEKYAMKWAAICKDTSNMVGKDKPTPPTTSMLTYKRIRISQKQYEHIGSVRGMAATYR